MADVTWDQLIVDVTEADFVIRSVVYANLQFAAQKVKADAEKKFGKYQPAVGPFPAWEPLNTEYVMQKGTPEDYPLIGYYRDGRNKVWPVALRNDLHYQTNRENLEAVIGTNDPLGLWHEYGLPDRENPLPARPFLRPALYENKDWIVALIKEAVVGGLKSHFK